MNRFWLALAIPAVWALPALAADHLVPGDNQLADYQAAVKAALKDAFAPDVRARAIAEPSFQAEYAVGIKETAGAYALFSIQPARQLWGQVQRPRGTPPADVGQLPVERCEAPLDAVLARGVIDVWGRMLAQTRPDESRSLGLDGETYYFSMDIGGRTLAGSTWSPDPQSRPGRLVGMVLALRRYCAKRQETDLTALSSLTRDLQARLKAP